MLWTSHLVDEGISLVNEVGKPGELWYGCDMPFLENGSWKPLRSDHEVWNQMAGCPRKASKWSTRRIGCAMKCWDHLKAFGYRAKSAMLLFHTCTWTCIRE